MKFAFLATHEAGGDQVATPSTPQRLPFPMPGRYMDPITPTTPISWTPIGITIDKAVEYWWRVKEWELTYEGGVGSTDFSGILRLVRSNVDSEEELCFPDRYEWFGTFTSEGELPFTITARIIMMPPPEYNPNIDRSYFMNSTHVVPAFAFIATVDYFDYEFEQLLLQISTHDELGNAGAVTIDGTEVDCTFSSSGALPTFDFEMVPKVWFAYDDVWNPNTGEKN